MKRGPGARIVFSNSDVIGVSLRDNDLMIIIMQYNNCDVKQSLFDPERLISILF